MHGLGMYVVQRGNTCLGRGHEWEDTPPNVRLESHLVQHAVTKTIPSSPLYTNKCSDHLVVTQTWHC